MLGGQEHIVNNKLVLIELVLIELVLIELVLIKFVLIIKSIDFFNYIII